LLKLQKIELLGFKSFAERTEIPFHGGGIAAIVGPNGCGKSNISDAISWVLGEQSPRSLRSGRMQDVIFSGTRGRKATGMAEVRLILLDPEAAAAIPGSAASSGNGHARLENSHPEPAHAEPHHTEHHGKATGEVVVARRLFQSGESEYLLNGRACRLRDIQEIFLGTGLGPDSYAIIEQGRIGQILTARPYERRALIEEAAGVTKFKAKRKLAWAKLESSRGNLSRVNDILDEITRQLNSLKRQAARARRYGELRDEMQRQLRTLLGSRFREKEREATGIALELSLLRHAWKERSDAVHGREQEQQQWHQQQEREEHELRRSVEERSSLRLEAERARSQGASQTQQITYLGARLQEAQAEQAQLEVRLRDLEQERERQAAVFAEVESEIQQLTAQRGECEQAAQERQAVLREKELRREQLRRDLLDTVHECATLRNQLVQIEQFLQETNARASRTEIERAAAETEGVSVSGRLQEAGEAVARQRENLSALTARRSEMEGSVRSLGQEEARQREQLAERRAELSARRARQSSLEEILSRRAYSTETVRRLFEKHAAKQNGAGTNGFPAALADAPADTANSNGAFAPAGVLADFLEVDAACEPAVEEFLRDELDYIVVKDWEEAQEGVRLLRSEVPGRASFLLHLPLHSETPHGNGEFGAVTTEPPAGVLGALETRLRFTNGFSGTAGALLPRLRRCYLVPDSETGRALAPQHPEHYFLTPEGDWFHGGIVTAGKADSSGPLALKRELRESGRLLAEQEEAVAQAAAALANAEEERTRMQEALRLLAEQQQEAEKQLLAAERDLREAGEAGQRLEERLQTFALELGRLGEEAERARRQRDRDAGEIALREQKRTEIEGETSALSEAIAALEASREATQARALEISSRLAALQERRRSVSETLERVERTLAETSRRHADLDRQGEEWSLQKAGFEENNRLLEQQAAAAEERSERLTARVAELQQSCERRRTRLAEIEQQLQQERADLEEVRNQQTAAEVQMARAESELAHLKETCRNELQVEIETVSADDQPPLGPEALAAAEETYRQLKGKIESLGPINMMALEEFEECRQRHEFLEGQRQDLLDSIRDTTQAIAEIDAVTQKQFSEAFEKINGNFQHTFETLFGGGQGLLRLTEAEDPSDAGIEIIAQPPGKRLQNVLLLSGGEKAMTALALLIAIFRYQPSPFCILDEVDAPLDEANIGRFTRMIQEMSRETQFILITHSKKTMSIAPVLYGVTMEEAGVSKIVSVRFNGEAVQPSGSPAVAAVGA